MVESTLHPDVIKAGEMISEDMMDASICKSLGNIGGGMELEDRLSLITENRDLVEAYVAERITCVEAIYHAMQRERFPR